MQPRTPNLVTVVRSMQWSAEGLPHFHGLGELLARLTCVELSLISPGGLAQAKHPLKPSLTAGLCPHKFSLRVRSGDRRSGRSSTRQQSTFPKHQSSVFPELAAGLEMVIWLGGRKGWLTSNMWALA
jgi:hypothetical protein